MFFIVRLFFIVILISVLLSMALGWLALARARMHIGRMFGMQNQPRQDKPGNVIEGEYKVLDEKEPK